MLKQTVSSPVGAMGELGLARTTPRSQSLMQQQPQQSQQKHRDRWSIEECRVFLKALATIGRRWTLFTKYLPERSAMQCYRRWYNVQGALWEHCVTQMRWSEGELCWLIEAAAPFPFPLSDNQWRIISQSTLNNFKRTPNQCRTAYLMLLSSRDLKRQLALANAVGSSPAWVPPPMRSAEDDLMIVHQDDSIIVKQDDLISCDDEDGGNDEEGGPDGTNFTMSTDSSDPESSDDDYRMKCGPWSVLEHQLLIDAVAEEGCHDELPVGVLTSENCLPVGWFRIADRVVKRTPLQCFLEWQLLLQSGFHSELGGSSVVSGNCFSMPSYW